MYNINIHLPTDIKDILQFIIEHGLDELDEPIKIEKPSYIYIDTDIYE